MFELLMLPLPFSRMGGLHGRLCSLQAATAGTSSCLYPLPLPLLPTASAAENTMARALRGQVDDNEKINVVQHKHNNRFLSAEMSEIF